MNDTEILQRILDATARLDERQRLMSEKVDRIERAVYGNGDPGLRNRMIAVEERLADLAELQAACPVFSMQASLDEIARRHADEDSQTAALISEKVKNSDEFRKFRWAAVGILLAALISTIFDIVRSLF